MRVYPAARDDATARRRARSAAAPGHCATRIPAATSAGAAELRGRQRLAVHHRPEHQCAEREEERDEGHRHRGQLAQQARERDEGERGPDRGEVDDRADRARRPRCGRPVLRYRRHDEQEHAAEDRRPSVQHERVDPGAAALGRDVPDRRPERRDDAGDGGEHGPPRVAERDALRERERQPAQRQHHAGEQPRPQRLAAQRDRRDQRDIDRQDAEEHRREAGGHVLLAPVDEPVRGGEREHAEDRREDAVGAQGAAPEQREHEQADSRQRESHTRPEQRRRVVQPDLDGHPRARPDGDEQGVERPDGGTGHRPDHPRRPWGAESAIQPEAAGPPRPRSRRYSRTHE